MKSIAFVLISFIISFTIFLFFEESDTVNKLLYKPEIRFFSQKFNPHKDNAYLLGSSLVGHLNTTYVNDFILTHGMNLDVYNLAIPGDVPFQRLHELKYIISTSPKIVIYGIEYRDFSSLTSDDTFDSTNKNILPDIKDLDKRLFGTFIIGNNMSYIDSPRSFTSQVIHNYFTNREFTDPKEPFYPLGVEHRTVMNNEELEENAKLPQNKLVGFDVSQTNTNVLALENIIESLQKNNIKVVLFTTPSSRIYLNSINEHDKQLFSSFVDELSKKYNIKVYRLDEKYADLNVWNDVMHVAVNEKTVMYSRDIAQIILNETET